MTETVNSSASGNGTAGETKKDNPVVVRSGLTMTRLFTTEGVHPYDQVKWELRDVIQQNWKTGETVFE